MDSISSRSSSICRMAILTALFLCLGWLVLRYSTIESTAMPIQPALAQISGENHSPGHALTAQLQPVQAVSSNPVASVFVNAVPGSEGATVYVSVSGVDPAGSPIVLNIDPGSGPGHHIGSYAMEISGTAYVATAIGFAPGQDVGSDGDDTMTITTTVGSEIVSSGAMNFQRAYVERSQPEMVSVDDGKFVLDIPNKDTFPNDVYVLVMSTNTAPRSLPIGYSFAGSTYNVRPSHSLTESDRLMTINLGFVEPLPGGSDPHTLSVVGWDPLSEAWDVLGGDLFDDDDLLNLSTRRFGIYALATVPAWRDSFLEWSLTGVLDRENTEQGPGESIVLSGSALSGTVTSILITPTGATNWGTLHVSATTSSNTALAVDVLDATDTAILDVDDGTDLSGLSLEVLPALKLRATLTRASAADPSPELHAWQVSWTPRIVDVYLPLVVRDGP